MSKKLKLDTQETITVESSPSLGSGGEGAVYRITSPIKYKDDFCIKLYSGDSKNKEEKIQYLIDNKPSILNNNVFKICFPLNLVYENKVFCGYLMPLAFNHSENLLDVKPLNFYRKPKLPQSFKKLYSRDTIEGILNRAKLCTNLALAINMIHQTNKYVLVDLKPDNILLTLDGKISIVDFDSVQISEGRVFFPATVCTPEYTPTEYYRKNLSNKRELSWDRFSFAVIFYEIIFGVHPFSATFIGKYDGITDIAGKIQHGLFVHGKNKSYMQPLNSLHPHKKFTKVLPIELQKLFIRTFDDGHSYPNKRITIEVFGKTFFDAVQNTTSSQKKTLSCGINNVNKSSFLSQKIELFFSKMKKKLFDFFRKVFIIVKNIFIGVSIIVFIGFLIKVFLS